MKLIIAYIQPEKLTAVKQALYECEIFKMSVTNALGCGQQKGFHESYRGAEIEVKELCELVKNEEFKSFHGYLPRHKRKGIGIYKVKGPCGHYH